MNELQWIKQMKQNVPAHPRLILGIGDDAAVLRSTTETIVTADMLLDGMHFDSLKHDAKLIGRKALAVNLSDIAAMGGAPYACVITLAVSRKQQNSSFLNDVYAGIHELAQTYNVAVAGGDTNTWDAPFAISITVWGDTHQKGIVRRSSAQDGDVIFVSGFLGDSYSGHHLSFEPQVHLAKQLMDSVDVHAMIDVSDGVATDLRHICEASAVGALLDPQSIPIQPSLLERYSREEALVKAMTDGEDFALCFTVNENDANKLLNAPLRDPLLSPIGRIRQDKLDLYWQTGDNKDELIRYKGYEHHF